MDDWVIFVLGVICFHTLRGLWLITQQELKSYRERRFLRFIRVTFPDRKEIKMISVATADRKTLTKLRKQIEEEYDLSNNDRKWSILDGDHQDRRSDRRGDGDPGQADPHHREDPAR